MQLKPLVVFLFTTLPVLTVATSPDTATINDISNLTNDLKAFDAAVQNWDLQENSSPAQAMKDQANKAVKDLSQTLQDAKKIESLTPDAQDKLVASMKEFTSVAGDVIKHMAEKVCLYKTYADEVGHYTNENSNLNLTGEMDTGVSWRPRIRRPGCSSMSFGIASQTRFLRKRYRNCRVNCRGCKMG